MRDTNNKGRLQKIAAAMLGVVFAACLLDGQPTTPATGQTQSRDFAADSGPLPQLLSESGLYDGFGNIDPRNRSFNPQYPLWSDGAAKSRWIYLPEGSQIDITDIDNWQFPVGTKLWKEFSWGGRKVETRMLRKSASGEWEFAAYVWNDDQTDAVLAPPEGIPAHFEIAPNKKHSIPGVTDCQSCHGSSPARVLGFNALQLSDDRDPLAPHAEPLSADDLTLKTLVAAHLVTPQREDLVESPPRIRESNPTARAAIGYLSANCGGCHNNSGSLARLGLNLLHNSNGDWDSPEPAYATTVDAGGRYKIPGIDPDSSRLVTPGNPDHSAILYRMHSRRPSSQMPPLGTVIRDEEALKLVNRWIEEMQPPVQVTADVPRL